MRALFDIISSSGRSPEELFLQSGNSPASPLPVCPSNSPSVNTSCYRVSSKTTGRIFLSLVRMFPSMPSCASTKYRSVDKYGRRRPSLPYLVIASPQNYLTDSNETCLLCSPQCLVVQVQKKIPVRRQIWPFGSRLGLSEISH